MTDPSHRRPPAGSSEPSDEPRSDDEVVSAYLDGEATDAEVARVESEPALAARLDRFAEISAAVRATPQAPDGALDDHLAAAMAAFEGAEPTGGTTGEAATGGVVVDRSERSFWQRVPLAAVAAAAAVVIVVAGLIGVATTGDDGADTAADQLAEQDDSSMGGTGAPEAFGSQEADGAGARPAFDSVDELALHLGQRISTDTAATSSADATQQEAADAAAPTAGAAAEPEAAREDQADPCDAVPLLGLDHDDVLAVVAASVEGRPVTAVVHRTEEGHRLVVVDDTTCTISAERPL